MNINSDDVRGTRCRDADVFRTVVLVVPNVASFLREVLVVCILTNEFLRIPSICTDN